MVAALNSPGLLAEGHDRIVAVARQRADADGWFIRANPARSAGTSVIAALAVGYVAFLFLGAMAWYLVPVLVSVVLTLAVVRHKLRRGQRTGLGRALTDQVEGFRRHLATVEADELRGAEGDDIFSRYLPWAILFDLTERWTTLCRQLVADGRLPDVAPAACLGAQQPALAVMPLVGFDADGRRLGMGGGWYDRSFAFRHDRAAPPWLVGAGFSVQQVPALAPAPWDIEPDAICTEDATHLPHREARNEPA